MKLAKQPNLVRGNQIKCFSFQMCPMCFGCRAYDSRLEECRECYELGIDNTSRNFNICNTQLHEAWKINKMVTKHTIKLDKNEKIMFSDKK